MYTVTTDRLIYQLPSNVCSIKSLKVLKVDPNVTITMVDPGKFDCDYYSIDYGWIEGFPDAFDESDK